MTTQPTLFDYKQVDVVTGAFIQGRTNEIKALVKRSARDIIEIGLKLIEVKECLPHGAFGNWLETEFGWTQQTAVNFMRVADKFKNFLNLDQVAPSALYLLAAPSTPDEAREEAIEQAASGERVTYSQAKEIVNRHKNGDTPAQDERFICMDCGEIFTTEVWHCPDCDHHWQPHQEDCPNCHNGKLAEQEGELTIPKARAASQPVQVTTFSSETNEYYTPPQYLELAREVMGRIDLDPASCEAAQQNVRAGTFYTKSDDGLEQDWFGAVWLNPPYGKTDGDSTQGVWAQKLIQEYKIGRVTEAILLVRAALGYEWFERLWYDWTVCFARERITFIRSDGTSDGQAKQGAAFFYFGPNVEGFRRLFRCLGRVIMPETEDEP